MSIFTPPEFITTDGGLAAASVATPVGPFVHIEGFRVGSAFGYTPLKTDTDLTGDLLYAGVPSTYRYAGDNTINVICKIPAAAGPFEFGEVCVDLAGGVMFAKAAFPTPQIKYSNLGTNVLSTYTFNCLLKLSQPVAIFKVDTLMGEPPSIWEVDKWSDVYPPALSANPEIPAILVRERDERGNSSLLHQASAAHWTVGTNYTLIYYGPATVAANSVVVTNADLKQRLPLVPIAEFNTVEQRSYVVETDAGYLRSVSGVTGNNSDTGSKTFALNSAMAGSLSGQISIYANRISLTAGVVLSKDANNLLALRADGLYYGTAAPEEIVNMFVDPINGNDNNIGSLNSPVRTIGAVVDRGPPGVNRYIYLKEMQDHWVDPQYPKALRGGTWVILPYGPMSDALPPVPGDSKFIQAAAIPLMPTIRSRPMYTTTPDAGGGVYQQGMAFVPQNGATVNAQAIRFTCADPVVGGAPVSSALGTYMSPFENGAGSQWILRNCQVDTTTGWFAGNAYSPITISLISGVSVIGSGKLCIAGSKLMSLDFGGGGIGTNTITAEQLMSYVQAPVTATKVYSNMNTNIIPASGGGVLERIKVPNVANYTMPADRIGTYTVVRFEGIGGNVNTATIYVNGTWVTSLDTYEGGHTTSFSMPLNSGDNVQVTGTLGTSNNTYAYVWLYPVGVTGWN